MFMFGLYLDPLYLVVFFVTIIISLAAQLYIRSQYGKWSGVRSGADLSGTEVGYAIVNRTTLGGGHAPSFETQSSELSQLAGLRYRASSLTRSIWPSGASCSRVAVERLIQTSIPRISLLSGWLGK